MCRIKKNTFITYIYSQTNTNTYLTGHFFFFFTFPNTNYYMKQEYDRDQLISRHEAKCSSRNMYFFVNTSIYMQHYRGTQSAHDILTLRAGAEAKLAENQLSQQHQRTKQPCPLQHNVLLNLYMTASNISFKEPKCIKPEGEQRCIM